MRVATGAAGSRRRRSPRHRPAPRLRQGPRPAVAARAARAAAGAPAAPRPPTRVTARLLSTGGTLTRREGCAAASSGAAAAATPTASTPRATAPPPARPAAADWLTERLAVGPAPQPALPAERPLRVKPPAPKRFRGPALLGGPRSHLSTWPALGLLQRSKSLVYRRGTLSAPAWKNGPTRVRAHAARSTAHTTQIGGSTAARATAA